MTLESIQRGRSASIPSIKTMGPCNRTKGRRTKSNRLQSIPHHAHGRRSPPKLHQRTIGKGVYFKIKITICITFLLYQEKRWQVAPSTRLPKTQRIHDQEQVSPAPNPRSNRPSKRCLDLYQIRYQMGIQQCPYQGRRSTQGSVQNEIWPLRT